MKDKKKTDPLVSTKVLLKPRFHYLLVNAEIQESINLSANI